MYKVVVVDWGDKFTEEEFGSNLAGALMTAQQKSIEGNVDYTMVFNGALPIISFEDGEEQ